MESEKKLSKRGFVSQTPEGELLLVNEKGTAYMVNEWVIAVWDLFDNKSVGEVVKEIAEQIDKDPNELKEPIQQLATALQEAELLVIG